MDKRKISVGFIQPKELEGNTIYVQIRHNSSSLIRAEAVSKEPFKYSCWYNTTNNSRIAKEDPAKTNRSCADLAYPDAYKMFLESLKTENNAEISEERFQKDGLTLTAIIKDSCSLISEDLKKTLQL